jgi:hypothetical protein
MHRADLQLSIRAGSPMLVATTSSPVIGDVVRV